MRARVVFEPLLHELEAGEPRVVERRMIGGCNRPRRDDLDAEVLDRFTPLPEQRQRAKVALSPDCLLYTSDAADEL